MKKGGKIVKALVKTGVCDYNNERTGLRPARRPHLLSALRPGKRGRPGPERAGCLVGEEKAFVGPLWLPVRPGARLPG